MSIIRNRITRKFTTIPNSIIIDDKLSHGAFRVYSYLLSKPDGWKVINTDIQDQLNIKQSQTLANYWKELISSGWISRHRDKNTNGKITGGYNYELNEYPIQPGYIVEDTTLGNNHNMDKPHCGKSINRENPQYINNTKEQDQNKTDLNNTYYPTPLANNAQDKTDGAVSIWLNQIIKHAYQFTETELQAIQSWAKYKTGKITSIPLQQIELTLKQLNNHKLAKQNIVYLIETSISRGYKGIMEPTKNSMHALEQQPSRYLAADYITPENQLQKIELRNYLERCYMRDRTDPRTNEPLTDQARSLFHKHFQRSKKLRFSISDYIYEYEVTTGICLLEQPIEE